MTGQLAYRVGTRMQRNIEKAGVIVGLGMLLTLTGASLGRAAERTPIVTTRRFAFYSDFDTNLNDALTAAGVVRKGGKTAVLHSEAEASCFGKLPQSARAAWDGAVGYYAEVISPADWSDRRKALESTWRPFIHGERTLSEAAAILIEALRNQG